MDTLLTRDEIRQIVEGGMHVPGSRIIVFDDDTRKRYDAEVDRLTAIFNGLQANFVRNTESCADDGDTASQDARKGQFQAILRALMAHYDKLYRDGQDSLVLAFKGDEMEGEFAKLDGTRIIEFRQIVEPSKSVEIEQSKSIEYGYSDECCGYYIKVRTMKETNDFLVNGGTWRFMNQHLIDYVVDGLRERGWLPSPTIGEFVVRLKNGSVGFDGVISLLRDCLSMLPSMGRRYSIDSPLRPFAERCGSMYGYIIDECKDILPKERKVSEEASQVLAQVLDIESVLYYRNKWDTFCKEYLPRSRK